MTSGTTPTNILLNRHRVGGDKKALDELLSRYLDRVLFSVRSRLGPGLRQKIESSDIVQETMLAALRSLKDFQYRGEGSFVSWLVANAVNRIRDEHDRQHAACRDSGKESPLQIARSDGSEIPLEIEDRGPPTSTSRLCETGGSRLTAKESFPLTSVRAFRNRCIRFRGHRIGLEFA